MPQTETATGVLREEHVLILKVVEVLEKVLDEGAGTPDLESATDCVTFLQQFADACHHGKEEDLLFVELEARGMPKENGPIAVMLDEHRRGRAFIKQMADSLDGGRAGDADALRALEAGGRNYIDLIRSHIFKENHILFDMADQMVDGPGCAKLCAAYGEVCSRRFDGRTKEELSALAARLQQKHAVA
jgi:hemerythrin-like domain-containing protein